MFFSIQQSDQIWKYFTEPAKESCLGYKNSVCHCPRGKLLGGCSTINAMIYQRGSKQDHDSWYQEGNEGWDYESLIEYYKKSENVLASLQNMDNYGREGLLSLTKYIFNETIRDVILQSAKELGYEILEEGGQLGFFESLQTIEDGVRRNAAKVFLGSSKKSSKLTLALNAHVENVIIDKSAKQAKGVKVKIGDRLLNLYADKEVILSAGALNSPQILMLSGVGPKRHLENVGIDVIRDLPVGEHLKDHVVMWVFSKLSDEALKPTIMLDEVYKYFAHRKGMLSHIGLANVQAFVNAKNRLTDPDLLFFYAIFPKNHTAALNSFLNGIHLNDVSSENLRRYSEENHIMVTFVILSQPKATGKILLRSKDASDYPEIHSGYFTDENNEDLETIIGGIRIVEEQIKTKAFKELNPQILDIGLPNCKDFDFDSHDYWRCAVRNLGTTMYHMTSTCRMGPNSDKRAVVDSRLKVHGIENLRVIDASICQMLLGVHQMLHAR
ncbi:hypothetical protein WA026_015209 [Henosepilachna vigintioctopunctata]|uniref:Glucose-methanol-choline oxidoreductase N-terminal domain-containing protein n=1 Tax=Henosepilachna vigintioctopunctata TaxID=420089 RepID=A0AAW1TTF7_9CUCU